jgi:5-carboxymethyl-2-hydroxymuconate isomerase
MPHLQFEVNRELENEAKTSFANEIREIYSTVMDTDTGHIAITIRELSKYNLTIGRASPEDPICLMNLDIREGRPIEERRELALKYMDVVEHYFDVKRQNQYVTFTQHPGEDFHLVEKYLADWESNEDPFV